MLREGGGIFRETNNPISQKYNSLYVTIMCKLKKYIDIHTFLAVVWTRLKNLYLNKVVIVLNHLLNLAVFSYLMHQGRYWKSCDLRCNGQKTLGTVIKYHEFKIKEKIIALNFSVQLNSFCRFWNASNTGKWKVPKGEPIKDAQKIMQLWISNQK